MWKCGLWEWPKVQNIAHVSSRHVYDVRVWIQATRVGIYDEQTFQDHATTYSWLGIFLFLPVWAHTPRRCACVCSSLYKWTYILPNEIFLIKRSLHAFTTMNESSLSQAHLKIDLQGIPRLWYQMITILFFSCFPTRGYTQVIIS